MPVKIKSKITKRFPVCLLPETTNEKSLEEIWNIKPVYVSVKIIRKPAK